jgi:SAM-dependent methyltransferase
MNYLNLGCGRRFHPGWVNLDFSPVAPNVRAHDLRKGIPYPDETFDVVYHSHVLEHLSKWDAPTFLRECRRVLRPGGLIRIAVPDLEQIARLYLEALEKASHGMPGWAENYDWMLLEMYDQAVREYPGGSCNAFYSQDSIPNWDFVYRRVGAEAEVALAYIRATTRQDSQAVQSSSKLRYIFRNPWKFVQHRLLKLLLSKDDYKALRIGRFRKQGEIHEWMYDAYSLARLLREAGFHNPQRCGATESQIPNWAQYCLDNESDGAPYKPDSMYMEALKP